MKTGLIVPIFLLGVAGHSPLAQAQSPGTFTSTGKLNTGRLQDTATLLPNGKALIAGGEYSTPPIPTTFFDFLDSAELYDPATGKFNRMGSMSVHRAYHKAILLANGKVLMLGEGFSSTAELYDPAIPTGDMILARTTPPTATLLNDGVFSAERRQCGFRADRRQTGSWPRLGTISRHRDWDAALPTPDVMGSHARFSLLISFRP